MNIKQVTLDEQRSCEGPLTLEECYSALNKMALNKSPGSDGLTVEFFQTFWEDIGHILVNVLNYCKEIGCLADSHRRAVITILHKQGKDPLDIKNYRPISLLNTDYKIMTKSIANRINPILGRIISPEQTGFIKNRYIGENIRLLSDIIDITERTGTPGALLLLDFEKAYDSVE